MVTMGERANSRHAPVRRRPPRLSSVQLKVVMALTGAVLLAYLVAHMLGNLKIFFGEQALNTYASWLREVGEPALPGEGMLWIVRVVLSLLYWPVADPEIEQKMIDRFISSAFES